jgi:hypothetical protein
VERFLASSVLGAAVGAAPLAGGTAAVGVRSLAYPEAREVAEYEETGRTLSGGRAGRDRGVGARRARRARRGGGDARAAAGRRGVGARRWPATPGSRGRRRAPPRAPRRCAGHSATSRWPARCSTWGASWRCSGAGVRCRAARAWGSRGPSRSRRRCACWRARRCRRSTARAARPAGGAELRWTRGRLALDARAGARRRLGPDEATPAVTAGAGLAFRGVTLDYAHQGYRALGATHRLGVRWAR